MSVSSVGVAVTPAAAQTLIPPTEHPGFRVLSLDGGGARGYLSVMILANIEKFLDRISGQPVPLGQRFDLIAGTSTGGIIGLGLATGRSAREISDFYRDLLPKIFNPNAQHGIASRPRQPKYDNTTLRAELEKLFGTATLEKLKTDVCITAVALQNGRPRFHKSSYQAANYPRLDERLSDIALATSAAPTYFPAYSLKHSNQLIDGGICANNPAVVALVEAINFERDSLRGAPQTRRLSDVVMVSVGTGKQPSMPYNPDDLANAGWIGWGQHIADVMFSSQSVVVDVQARYLLKEKYKRLNPDLSAATDLDDVSHLDNFKNISDLARGDDAFFTKYFLP